MRERLCKVQVPDLLVLYEEVDILRSKVHSLAERHIPIIPLILSFMQVLPRPPPMVFNLFSKDDEAPPIGAKGGYEDMELDNPNMEIQWTLKKSIIDSSMQHTDDERRRAKMALGASLGASSIHTPPPSLGNEPCNDPDEGKPSSDT